jgi:hypothetical protein
MAQRCAAHRGEAPLMRRSLIATGLVVLAAACGTGGDGGTTTADAAVATTTTPTAPDVALPPVASEIELRTVTSSGGPDGNRVVAGAADLSADPVEVTLPWTPAWVVGTVVGDGVVWVVANADGKVTAVTEVDGLVTDFSVGQAALAPGAAPTLIVGGSAVSVYAPSGAAPLAGHTVVNGTAVTIDTAGIVFVGGTAVDNVVALSDGRIVVSGRGEVAFLAEPTDRLAHGVLADLTESESVVILRPDTAEVQAVLDAPEDTVFEAIAPLWADVNGDGVEEVVVTASDAERGARLAVYSPEGVLIGQSQPIGTGGRWLNQLAAAPLGPEGEIEMVEVRTPHIGGIVRWYRLEGDTLQLEATAEGYSTHRIGSRNLDQGLVIDADGNGRLDVVVPTQDQATLEALTRTAAGVETTMAIPLGARLATNIAAAPRRDGSASVALGTEDARLLIWP